jgi:hypothetical protein
MKVEVNKPDIIQFCISPEKEDELYTSCMWARITFDNKNWSMMAQSDCGDDSYSWVPEKDRTFLQLMQRIDGEYLLGKVSDRRRFDEESSKKNLIDWVSSELDSERLAKEIKGINVSSEGRFIREVEEIDGMEDFPDLWECLEHDYPQSAKTFCRIFTECIQPEIRKFMKFVK